jgi:hypothetical protein
MAQPTKPLLTSTTTQNVAVGAVGAISAVQGVVTLLRATNVAPWPAEADNEIALALTAILVPLASRVMAWLRALYNTYHNAGYLPIVIAMVCASLLLPGCMTITETVTSPDGTIVVTERSDPAQIQWVMGLTQSVVGIIQAQLEADDTLTEEERIRLEHELDLRRAQLELLRAWIDGMKETK